MCYNNAILMTISITVANIFVFYQFNSFKDIATVECIKTETRFDSEVYSWFKRRHNRFSQYDYPNKYRGMRIAEGNDRGKPITVENCGRTNVVSGRIVNGQNVMSGEFPWMVLIMYLNEPLCGGTILNERWIITAAHCFIGIDDPQTLLIRVGTIDRHKGTEYQISKIIVHERYNWDGMENCDVALLNVQRPIAMEYDNGVYTINGICLPETPQQESQTNLLTVTGFGRLGESSPISDKLLRVQLRVIRDSDCAKSFHVPLHNFPNGLAIYTSQICTWEMGRDACQGDSGGPAIEYSNGVATLVGIVSYGVGCATEFPGIFTQVSYFLDWISKNMQ